MELWQIISLYVVGLGLAIAECFVPGGILGLIGAGALVTSISFGFMEHWGIGATQIAITVVAVPIAFMAGMKRVAHKTSLAGSASFAKDYTVYNGREGEAKTALRPAGMVEIDGDKVDVVTGGEMVEQGQRVRVIKVEGNRVVVRAV